MTSVPFENIYYYLGRINHLEFPYTTSYILLLGYLGTSKIEKEIL